MLTNIIIQNTKPSDKILVKGYRSEVYLYSGRASATRFSHVQHQSSLAKDNYIKDAEKALPKMIIQDNPQDFGKSFNLDSLLHNRYKLINTIDNTEIWKLKE